MTTPEMIRCHKCGYLEINPDGTWICSANGFEIHEGPNRFDSNGECEARAIEADGANGESV